MTIRMMCNSDFGAMVALDPYRTLEMEHLQQLQRQPPPLLKMIPARPTNAWKSRDPSVNITNDNVPLSVPVVDWPLAVAFATMNALFCRHL
jgi:hypothetical protein